MTIRKKPLIIEFTGPPNSGKTTLVNFLHDVLSKCNYSVEIKQEDAELVPKSIPKKTWARNAWITLGQLQSLIEVNYSTSDVVLIDRGYYDSLFWPNLLKLQGVCSEQDCLSAINIIRGLDSQFNFKPDYLFVIDVSTEVSLKRRYAMENSEAVVLSTNSFIDLYKEQLDVFCEKYKTETSIFKLDTSGLTFVEMQNIVLNKVSSILKC